METGVHEEAGHGVRGDRLAIDGGDENALMAAGAYLLLTARAEKMREARGSLRTLRLLGGKKDKDVWIAAPEPRYQSSVAQNHLGIGGAGEDARCGLRIFVGYGKVGPAQDRAVRVGWIGGSHLYKLGSLFRRCGAQLAQQINGGRKRELRCAKAGNKIATANPAAFFQSLENVVDRAESAEDVFRGDGFAQQDAVAVEQLQGEGVAGFGGSGVCAALEGHGFSRAARCCQRNTGL